MFFNQNTSSKLFLLYFVEKIEEAGASDVGGNIYSSLTLTFGCYGSPSFLKNKVKKETRLSLKRRRQCFNSTNNKSIIL